MHGMCIKGLVDDAEAADVGYQDNIQKALAKFLKGFFSVLADGSMTAAITKRQCLGVDEFSFHVSSPPL